MHCNAKAFYFIIEFVGKLKADDAWRHRDANRFVMDSQASRQARQVWMIALKWRVLS